MPRRLSNKNLKSGTEKNQDAAPDFSSQLLPKTTMVKKQKNDNLKKQLAQIYSEVGRENYEEPPKSRHLFSKFFLWFVAIALILSGAAWAGFLMFGQGTNFSEADIELTTTGPEKAFTGDTVTYKINYRNANRLPLAKSSLSIYYPDGFKFISANPAANPNDTRNWDLGALDPNQSGTIEIVGQVSGNAGADLTLRTFFNYRPSNFNSDFQKINNFTTHLESLPLVLTFIGPDSLDAGGQGDFIVSLVNSSDKNFNNLDISLILPTGLKISKSAPKPTEGLIWKIPALNTGASSTIALTLVASSDTLPGDKKVSANFNLHQNNQIFLQKTVEKNISIAKTNLVLQVAANGVTDKQSINFGDKINLAFSYENTGNTSLKNVSLRLIIDAPSVDNKSLLDWANIDDKTNGDITGEQINSGIRRGVITWTKKQIPALAEIKPQGKGLIELSLPVKSKTALNVSKLTETKTTIYAEMIFGTGDSTTLQSNNINLILNSDLNLSTQATFKESKDLPLAIGKKYDLKSIYTVTWIVTNSLHELTDLKITATLPENVDWEKNSSASAGDIAYDETTKQISWTLNRLPLSAKSVTITFDAGVKSEKSEKGNGAPIIQNTRVEATDKVTGENILLFKDPILTIL